ncbi:MAG: hypothetical protein AJITA_01319 [Acetilactobacillus jinshanensis]
MKMTERQLIQEILNTVDVTYSFEDVDEDNKQYTLLITRQSNDRRDLDTVNKEMKHYFKDADFSYKEDLHPDDNKKIDARVVIARQH